MRSYWLWTRDLRLEFRSPVGTLAVVSFLAVVILILGLALGPDPAALQAAAPGALWLALAFAGSLLGQRVWSLEVENQTLDELFLSPGGLEWVYWGKLAFTAGLVITVGILALFLLQLAFSFSPLPLLPHLVTLFLGGLGYSIVATFLGALTARLRSGEILLPLLLFPLVVPVVLASVRASSAVANGSADYTTWWGLLVVFDAVYLAGCSLIFPWMQR